MPDIIARIRQHSDFWRENAPRAEQLGRLPDDVAAKLTELGVVRLLQSKRYGGCEAHPRTFFESVFELGRRCGSTGWVAGVVGVHPHELSQADPRLQEELWGRDPDTWVASPYAPMGRATPVPGGYDLTGRWSFSSGTDHCQWVVIGGRVLDDTGEQIGTAHFCLPRGDYEIVDGSWEVMGLRGTGSKDLVVEHAFVPEHRVIAQEEIVAGTAARAQGLDNPLYSIPRDIIFSGAITMATLALCQGVLDAYVEHARDRVSRIGGKASCDPHTLAALAESAADIQSAVQHFHWDIDRVYDTAAAGDVVDKDLRIEVRRNQAHQSARAVAAADRLFVNAGGASLHLSHPLQRMWRDAHAARNHMMNTTGPAYEQYGLNLFGHELPKNARY